MENARELPVENVKDFILAGNAYFTLESSETGNRFTYRVKPERFDSSLNQIKYYKVEVLTGQNNTSDYLYIGFIDKLGENFKPKRKEAGHYVDNINLEQNAKSIQAFLWYYHFLIRKNDCIKRVKFYHAGRCARCGRLLTTPESIESGYGPYCITVK